MKQILISENQTTRWLGVIALVLLLVEPWLMGVSTDVSLFLAGVGIIGVATYIEFLPFFRRNFLSRLAGVLLSLGIFILNVIYAIIVFMILQK